MKNLEQIIKFNGNVIFNKKIEVSDEIAELTNNYCINNDYDGNYKFENEEAAKKFVDEFIEKVLPKAKNVIEFCINVVKLQNANSTVIEFSACYTEEDTMWEDGPDSDEDNFGVNFGKLLEKYKINYLYFI